MPDPSAALQTALVGRLKADDAITALVLDRVYDSVPPAPTFPYIALGEGQVIPEHAGCYEGAETTLVVHAWSRDVGFPEVKRLGSAIIDAVQYAPLDLGDGHALVDLLFEGAHYLRDPDGLTRHGVLTFKAFTDPL